MSALSLFHPVVGRWFAERVGDPTEIQEKAWPEIATGRHALITAPTGSGKTLTAFLWSLDRLLTGGWEPGGVRVLYLSPLKALNNDIRRNLLVPLAELEGAFAEAGVETPAVRVMTRSGDTTAGDRRKMIRQPPEILITTPESLNILLTSKSGRAILTDLETVILDEIHAVAGSKRGTHLITAVERLVLLSGEFQRIALSATIRPLERIARFVGGWEMEGPPAGSSAGSGAGAGPREEGEDFLYRRRRVSILKSSATKTYDLAIRYPEDLSKGAPGAGRDPRRPGNEDLPSNLWEVLARDFKRVIRTNRSTLFFANNRRLTERVTRLVNEGEEKDLAYSHHGSLSREIRTVVEERLKEGRLSAIVATNSLELGIDIGTLDEVVMIQTPKSVSSAVQRIGRAGHGVGEVSRGRMYPTFGRDFLDAAVLARSVLDQEVEEVRPVAGALDVLAQVILSMTAAQTWDLDELHRFLRSTYPYHRLSRRQFDLVVDMLAGRYADSRIRELKPRVSIDRIDNTVRARRGGDRLIYLSGGTIPDRGYFNLRLLGSGARLGELDEEFVWERKLGDTFTLGAQSWRIRQITHNDVRVSPAPRGASMAPFWRAEQMMRGVHLSRRIAAFLEDTDKLLARKGGERELLDLLVGEHCMEPPAAEMLLQLLEGQRSASGVALPHRHHLLIEEIAEGGARSDRKQVVLHTLWGGRVNRPLAIALAAAWEARASGPLEIQHEDDCIAMVLPRRVDGGEVLALVTPENVESLLRSKLESTGFFGARFRENAGRALLLPRAGFSRRIPLWLNRQRSKKILEAIRRYDDFPILAETWRTCLQDEFDLEGLREALEEVDAGEVSISQVRTQQPTPFASTLVWKQTNFYMYEGDDPEAGGPTALSPGLLRELVFSSRLRPRISGEVIDAFQRKLHRVFPGYAPRSPEDLLDWVKERILIPGDEWRELMAAIERDGGSADEILAPVAAKIVGIELPRADPMGPESPEGPALRCAAEDEARVRAAFAAPSEASDGKEDSEEEDDPLVALLGEWIRFYGPFPRTLLTETLGLPEPRVRDLLAEWVEAEQVVIDQFRPEESKTREESGLEICDAENLEILLRLTRAAARPAFEALGLEQWPLFLAHQQGLIGSGQAGQSGQAIGDLQKTLDGLFGYPAPAALWERELLPARLAPYFPSWLDTLMQESDLTWFGCGRERLSFAFDADLELFAQAPSEAPAESESTGVDLFPNQPGRFTFEELAAHSGLATAELTERLWGEAWQGRISNTTFGVVRKGILGRFRPVQGAHVASRAAVPVTATSVPRGGSAARGGVRSGVRRRRRGFDRWQATRPYAGDWFRLEEPPPPDPLEGEELNKDRARLLLQRYGVVFRELLARELPALAWSRLFRTLRIMELSGEVLSGHFFAGVQGLQFASHSAFRALRDGLPQDAIFWLNAADPASPCGVGLEELKGTYPSRLPSNHLVFHGPRLVLTSRRTGGELEIQVRPGHPKLPEYFGFLKTLLTREFDPVKAIDVETINGEPAAKSPYAPKLAGIFSATREYKTLKLRRRFY